jgi:PilZ domain
MRGVSWNLSQGGMQVEVRDLKPKEAVQLSFRLPVSGVAVDVVGAVAWGEEKRHGIQFTYMGAQSQQSILQYIAEQMER